MPPMMRRMGGPVQKVPVKENIAKLMKSFRPYFVPTIISFVFVLISTVLAIVAPHYLSELTNVITDHAGTRDIPLEKIGEYGLILIIFYIVNAICAFSSSFIMNVTTQRYSQRLRNEISVKINKMPLKYFDAHHFGDTLSIITNDVDTIAQSLQQSVTMLFQSVFMLVGVLIAMFVTSWQMALTVLVSIPLLLIVLGITMKFAVPLFRKRQELIGQVNGIVEENFTGQLVIKAFNAEETKGAKFNISNSLLNKTMFKAQFFGGIMMPMMSFVSYFSYATVFLVGGLLLSRGQLIGGFGTITAFTVYVNLFQNPLSQIAQAMNSVQMAAAASSRVFEFLEEKELTDESEKVALLDHNCIRGEVEFKNVRFGYDENRIIIPDFSAKVEPGMKVAIVGPTGAGKTTMVNLLMRFYEVNSGDILIDGVSVKDLSRSELRSIFGMVLQDTWMFEGTVKENIVFNKNDISDERVKEVIDEANLSHYVSTLSNGYDTVLSEASSLSTGQRQLLTIARAMAENSPLLILDEATSNVDTRTEIQIQEAMDKLTKGRTSFVIAHRLSTIKNADLILVMKDGNIIEQGNHEKLLADGGFYASLYNSQFELE
ncbi:MAG: ABC transporter ATP-binding protein/permease [Bacilli bacterium]|nr:ABC transporter ATP-binding protein/permease [Bacilli bacterium]